MAGNNSQTKKIPTGFVLRLAWKDLRHEWILSICLIMAVTAVLGPLFILFGLKFGSIQILRNRLIDDPRNREIRPMISTRFEQQWFQEISSRPDVTFVVPMTRQISTSVQACITQADADECVSGIDLDLLPTAEGDPLLLQNKAVIPEANSCVLTARAAEELQAETGKTLLLTVRRIIGGRYEKVHLQLIVQAILDARAGATKAMFVGLPVLEAVERYKDGGGVPEYGWPGQAMSAYVQYDGLILWLPEPLKKLDQMLLKNNTGFSLIESLQPLQLQEKTGIHIGRGGHIYLLTTRKKAVGQESITSVSNRLRGKHGVLIPWVRPFSATYTDSHNTSHDTTVMSLGYSKQQAAELAITPEPPWGELADSEQAKWLRGFTRPPESSAEQGVLTVVHGENSLAVPLVLSGTLPAQYRLFVPAQLAGMFRLLADRQVVYDPNQELFLLSRQGYAGFRLYTATIDEVYGLRLFFEERGIPVSTQADRIRDVQELNYYLTLIFWVIAAAAALGGSATLAASLYASVERKRRDIGVLRLLGLSRTTLLRFPLYQGMILSTGGWLVALSFFGALAWLINSLFRSLIMEHEYLCILYPLHIGAFALIIAVITIISAIAAAWRITRLEPVDALRDE